MLGVKVLQMPVFLSRKAEMTGEKFVESLVCQFGPGGRVWGENVDVVRGERQ